ncbi:5-dehydro-2-deoxygluconokinase [Spiroplasma alleghenense]|uniref:5-dehydro-2-deoxygluconokinase n=1 Tax=Spiroplasma alleghenense TaxID=216931 RepID=A0A345Z3G2_9MOLU|nr:5-dehydro-2-deoxygluconokinase [Spiroplasma alleghenense]AXK51141.1 5-dehydro-2-deoxygluconokinase [Spiroplasma alleghenense]
MNGLDIITFGRACIDLNSVEINVPMEKTKTFAKYVGGSPANIAIGCANLGLNVGFIGKLSSDQHGRFINNYLMKKKINTNGIVWDRDNHKSGLTFTEILSPEECSIMMYRQKVADLFIKPSELDEDFIKTTKMVLISGTSLCSSPSRETALKLIEICEENFIEVIFELDYRPYNWKNELETSIYYNLVASHSRIIIGTRDEFDKIFIKNKYSDLEIAEYFLNRNSHLVVIKHGEKGSKAFLKDGTIFESGIFKTKVLKTFGAGDSFASGFLYGYITNQTIMKSLIIGSAAAAIVVSSHSSSESMPTLEKIKEFIKLNEGEKNEVN